jgi:hypothetical protein
VTRQADGFFVAPFAFDGELEGVAFRELTRLSAKWLAVCEDQLRQRGASFDTAWPGPLSHIRTKFTSQRGAALVTFWVRDRPAVSMALATGMAPEVESEVLTMFVESLRAVETVRMSAQSKTPFDKVKAIAERPLMIVVVWSGGLGAQDEALVRELGLHLGGAFFSLQSSSQATSLD